MEIKFSGNDAMLKFDAMDLFRGCLAILKHHKENQTFDVKIILIMFI